jgi:hypothetical protein
MRRLSNEERRALIAEAAVPTPKGTRLDLSLYVYPDGHVWFHNQARADYSTTSVEAAAAENRADAQRRAPRDGRAAGARRRGAGRR